MFDKLKSMGALAGLLKNQDAIREATERFRDKAARITVTGEAGRGAAKAQVSGDMRILSIELAHGLLMGMAMDEKTRTLASSLICEAVNDGLRKAQEKSAELMQEEARALGIDGLDLPGLSRGSLP